MKNETLNNIKLGIFVFAGLCFLILLFYMIGKNKNIWGSNFVIHARFENVQGLKPGNNVRFAGIDIGTVDKVFIINDTTIEVIMNIEDKLKGLIKKNTTANVITDGLVGNKIVNLVASRVKADPLSESDILNSKRPVDTDEMLRTLFKTNNDIATIVIDLKNTLNRINHSEALWEILNDKNMVTDVKSSFAHINQTSIKLNNISSEVNELVLNVKKGNGNLGKLFNDTALYSSLRNTTNIIGNAGKEFGLLTIDFKSSIKAIEFETLNGNGLINTLLKDSITRNQLKESTKNMQEGTERINEILDATKHSFLFRNYFKTRAVKRKSKS
jgi:phospholipid/cholesterol/gamma-HCH transport system substrate-binding protein